MRILLLNTFLILVLASGMAQNLKPTKALSYDEAIALVIENNETLKQSAIKVEQREQEAKAKLGLYMPKVSLSANYVMMTEPLHLDLTPVRDAITPLYDATSSLYGATSTLYGTLGNYGNFSGVPNPDPNTNTVMPTLPDNLSTAAVRGQLQDGAQQLSAAQALVDAGKAQVEAAEWDQMIQEQNFGMVSANFTLPLYTGGKIRIANKAARINVEEANAESRQKFGEVSQELAERYYGLLLAQKVEDVRIEVMSTMAQHMSDAEKMKEEGIISHTQYLQAKVYYTEAKREKEKAEKQVMIVNDALLNTLSIDEPTQIEVMSSFFYHEKLESLSFFKDAAQKNSPLLEQIDLKKSLVEQKIHLEKGSYLPNVAAMGTYHLADKDLSPYLPEGMVGVGLSWSIFEGTTRNKNLKAAKLQNQQVELYYDKSKTNIETMITKHYNEAIMYLDQIHQLESSKEFAEEYYNACEKSFKEGLIPSVDVSDANLYLAKIEIEQLKAAFDYDVSLAKLLYYSGIPENYADYIRTGIAVK